MTTVGTLEEEARKRKLRLAALKAKKEGHGEEPADAEKSSLPKPVFRSYKPADDSLKETILPTPEPIEVADQVKEQLEKGKPEPIIDEVDLATLAPRKPDWDLKRDVSKRLEKLEKRTQRAIAELIRERLQAGDKAEDGDLLARAVSGATQEDEDD